MPGDSEFTTDTDTATGNDLSSKGFSGKFISVEGVEGVGKSSNHQFVAEFLENRGYTVVKTREPGGTPEAEKIRALLLDRDNTLEPLTEALLMFASRKEHIEKIVKPALRAGNWVVSDRFVDASYAYQGGGRGLGEATIKLLDDLVLCGLKPDLTLLLDLDVETGLQRIAQRAEKDRIEVEPDSFFNIVRGAYHAQVTNDPERFSLIDASVPLLEVQSQIEIVLGKFVEGVVSNG